MSFTKLTYHIVFATKDRRRLIGVDIQRLLYGTIYNIAKSHGAFVHRIGGVSDHVHILVDIPAKMSVSQFVQSIKQQSSKILGLHLPRATWYGWEEGYGAFSVSYKDIDTIKQYIINQPEHHRTENYADELDKWLIKLVLTHN